MSLWISIAKLEYSLSVMQQVLHENMKRFCKRYVPS